MVLLQPLHQHWPSWYFLNYCNISCHQRIFSISLHYVINQHHHTKRIRERGLRLICPGFFFFNGHLQHVSYYTWATIQNGVVTAVAVPTFLGEAFAASNCKPIALLHWLFLRVFQQGYVAEADIKRAFSKKQKKN